MKLLSNRQVVLALSDKYLASQGNQLHLNFTIITFLLKSNISSFINYTAINSWFFSSLSDKYLANQGNQLRRNCRIITFCSILFKLHTFLRIFNKTRATTGKLTCHHQSSSYRSILCDNILDLVSILFSAIQQFIFSLLQSQIEINMKQIPADMRIFLAF